MVPFPAMGVALPRLIIQGKLESATSTRQRGEAKKDSASFLA